MKDLKENLNIDKYTFRVEWSEEDQTHIARCLEFPSLSADGPDLFSALNELKVVIKSSIEWMLEEGEEIPAPLSLKKFSGKVLLRMPEDIHRKAVIQAKEQNTSLNQYLLSKVSA